MMRAAKTWTGLRSMGCNSYEREPWEDARVSRLPNVMDVKVLVLVNAALAALGKVSMPTVPA